MTFEVRTQPGDVPAGLLVADRRLWLSEDRATVVEDGDPAARFLLAGPGSEIAPDEVARLGLGVVDGRVAVVVGVVTMGEPQRASEPGPEPPATEPPADAETKARPAPANKARRKGEDK